VADDYSWLSTDDVCELLGMRIKHIYRLVDHGVIPAYRFGRLIRFRRAEIDALFAR